VQILVLSQSKHQSASMQTGALLSLAPHFIRPLPFQDAARGAQMAGKMVGKDAQHTSLRSGDNLGELHAKKGLSIRFADSMGCRLFRWGEPRIRNRGAADDQIAGGLYTERAIRTAVRRD
jgi:hypothetical protein